METTEAVLSTPSLTLKINKFYNNFVIYYQNVQSLVNKLNCFLQNDIYVWDAFVITETWLKNHISSCEFFDINEYDVFRKDRVVKTGGGVLIAIKNKYKSILIDLSTITDDFGEIDLVGINFVIDHRKTILIAVYIPPQLGAGCVELFLNALSSVIIGYDCQLIIVGDFNIPHLSCNYTEQNNDPKSHVMNNFLLFHDLQQRNSVKNVNNRILDFVLTNIDIEVIGEPHSIFQIDPHHPPLKIEVNCVNSIPSNIVPNVENIRYNYFKADYIKLNDILSKINWNVIDDCDNVDNACVIFYNYLRDAIAMSVPIIKPNKNINYPPWFSSNVIDLIKLRNKMYIKYKTTKLP